MTFAIVSVALTLLLVLALNWQRFGEIGWGQSLRMVLIWGVILAALTLVVTLVGVPDRFKPRPAPTAIPADFT